MYRNLKRDSTESEALQNALKTPFLKGFGKGNNYILPLLTSIIPIEDDKKWEKKL